MRIVNHAMERGTRRLVLHPPVIVYVLYALGGSVLALAASQLVLVGVASRLGLPAFETSLAASLVLVVLCIAIVVRAWRGERIELDSTRVVIYSFLAGPTRTPVSEIKAITPHKGSWMDYMLTDRESGEATIVFVGPGNRALHVLSIDRMNAQQASHLAQAIGVPFGVERSAPERGL